MTEHVFFQSLHFQLENGFLSDEKSKETLPLILKQIIAQLNQSGTCSVPVSKYYIPQSSSFWNYTSRPTSGIASLPQTMDLPQDALPVLREHVKKKCWTSLT
jgi:hypothetical protein